MENIDFMLLILLLLLYKPQYIGIYFIFCLYYNRMGSKVTFIIYIHNVHHLKKNKAAVSKVEKIQVNLTICISRLPLIWYQYS